MLEDGQTQKISEPKDNYINDDGRLAVEPAVVKNSIFARPIFWIFVVVAIALVIITIFVVKSIGKSPGNTASKSAVKANNALVNVGTSTQPTVAEVANYESVFKQAISSTYNLDKDFDGLTDDEEKIYNTDPLLSDTDKDGLSDRAEIFIYKSDPLDSDTDDDGYSDGHEVRRGYSPIGPGTL
ncbi:MAG: thrombospondin type 3 repeat-containing protein [bacterium]